MTNKEKAIVMAYTGVCMLSGDKILHFYKYIEELMGRPVFTHELADEAICDEIKEKAKPDFLKLCAGKTISDTEPKSETNIIDLLWKLRMATWDYNIAHRKHIGVLVEDLLNFLLDAMEERPKEEDLEKEEKETKEC